MSDGPCLVSECPSVRSLACCGKMRLKLFGDRWTSKLRLGLSELSNQALTGRSISDHSSLTLYSCAVRDEIQLIPGPPVRSLSPESVANGERGRRSPLPIGPVPQPGLPAGININNGRQS